MPQLTDAQLQGLASADLDAGTELDQTWDDPHPDAPCWGFALFGGPGGHADNTPPAIYDQAWGYDGGREEIVYNPGFVAWVGNTFANPAATAQAQVVANNAASAADDDAPGNGAARLAITGALARLCMILGGLTLSANNGTAPGNPPVQYVQRDAGVNPVNTRSAQIWGHHPILTTVYITGLLDGHVEYLRHAVGWPP